MTRSLPDTLATVARDAGCTDADLAQGRAWAAEHPGPEATWSLDGTERHEAPGYRCPPCRDSGWVRRDVLPGHPDFGRPFPCSCRTTDPRARREVQERRIARSGLAAHLARCSLDTFQHLPGTQHTLDALRGILETHRTRDEHDRWLVLGGGPGRGKTHLLAAMVPPFALLDDVAWLNLPDWLDAAMANQFAQADALIRRATDVAVLIVDEFGAAGAGDWARERLERILNARYAARATTLIGLTVPIATVEDWSPRIASRFADVRLCRRLELTCGDYRRRAT